MNPHRALAQEILKAVGGASNIESFTNCITRLRINLVNRDIIDEAKI